ncbi:Rad52/Rad22 family DNA repair protein [Fusobacterium animalis]|uniref:Rad52/Rad22 family DNA repair protein n=2 Tax=Fusobacterium TaxID=848 RepID=UPI0030D23250
MEKLKEKFLESELEFRIGSMNSDKTMALALPYVQARAIQNRLDDVVGFHNWQVSYREISGGFICSLSLCIDGVWITKEDGAGMTDFESIKGGISNAFKRVAASGFGIGRYLYEFKKNWYPVRLQGRNYVFSMEPKLENKGEVKDVTEEKNTNISAKRVIVNFGKYKGSDLLTIYNNDPKYINYLLDKSKDENILNACKELIKKGA